MIVEVGTGDQRNDTEKTLGLQWDTRQDTLGFSINNKKIPTYCLLGARRPTKREYLKVIMSVFDPLGILAPLLIQSKIILQAIWVSGVGWDQPLANDEHALWLNWLESLAKIGSLVIPRPYNVSQKRLRGLELHIFCDASLKAYTTAAYWRFIYEDQTVHVSLIASKSRVALLKPLSVPRLELQAALLGCRLAQIVGIEHKLKVDKRIFWSDSRTVFPGFFTKKTR